MAITGLTLPSSVSRADRTASVKFAAGGVGDSIPDERMEEIVRRLFVILPVENVDYVIRSSSPPSDHTKIWYDTNEQEPKAWSSSASEWIGISNRFGGFIAALSGNMIRRDESGAMFVVLSEDESNILTLDDQGALLLAGSSVPGACEVFEQTISTNSSGACTLDLNLTKLDGNKSPEVSINWMDTPKSGATWKIDNIASTQISLKFEGLDAETEYTVRAFVRKT